MKLPVTFPNPKNVPELGMKVEHPAPVIMLPDVGLEMVQLVILDRKYEPSTSTDVPIGPLVVWPTFEKTTFPPTFTPS
jgi:hypothetical protein